MFVVSTQVRYALRALTRLALQEQDACITLATISEYEGISRKYLENIFKQLKKSGVVRSMRGPGGGYRLGNTPDKISLRDIVEAVEGPVVTVGCIQDDVSCDRDYFCLTQPVWREFQDHLVRFLSSKTLESVLESSGYVYKRDPADENTSTEDTDEEYRVEAL